MAHPLVQDDVVPLGPHHVVAADAQQLRNCPTAQAGAVHHPAGRKLPSGGGDAPVPVSVPAQAGDLTAEAVVHPVVVGVLRQSDGQAEGVHNTAVGGEHGKLPHHRRHQPVELRLVHQAQALHPVGLPLGDGAPQVLQVLLCVAHQHLAAALEGHVQLPGQLSHELVALHAQPGLQRAGVVGEAPVDHPGVAPAGLIAHVQIFLQYADFQAVPAHFPGNGAAHHAAADDQHIIKLLHIHPPKVLNSSHEFKPYIPHCPGVVKKDGRNFCKIPPINLPCFRYPWR